MSSSSSVSTHEEPDLDWEDALLRDSIAFFTARDDAVAEPAAVSIPLPPSNKGYQLLERLGWRAGNGLGPTHRQGRTEPVPHFFKTDLQGVGKQREVEEMADASTAKRKMMESEILAVETEEQRVKREIRLQKEDQIKEEIKTVTAAFYCELCDKQYNKISEYENHLSSYDHHHKKRFKEMQEMTKRNMLPGTGGGAAKKRSREEREREREEKELKRIQDAMMERERARGGGVVASAGFKPVSGFSPIAPADAKSASSSAAPSVPGSGFKTIGGFKPIDPAPASASHFATLPPPPPPPPVPASRSGFMEVPPPPPASSPRTQSSFQLAGRVPPTSKPGAPAYPGGTAASATAASAFASAAATAAS
ncbi:hypothetical protein DFJ73DRAFT_22392 [Zopfochytrium polystomum]|nr:hypothetical protein DFJ73DRAFT_22392 [Zopfochytrium polystomum]